MSPHSGEITFFFFFGKQAAHRGVLRPRAGPRPGPGRRVRYAPGSLARPLQPVPGHVRKGAFFFVYLGQVGMTISAHTVNWDAQFGSLFLRTESFFHVCVCLDFFHVCGFFAHSGRVDSKRLPVIRGVFWAAMSWLSRDPPHSMGGMSTRYGMKAMQKKAISCGSLLSIENWSPRLMFCELRYAICVIIVGRVGFWDTSGQPSKSRVLAATVRAGSFLKTRGKLSTTTLSAS